MSLGETVQWRYERKGSEMDFEICWRLKVSVYEVTHWLSSYAFTHRKKWAGKPVGSSATSFFPLLISLSFFLTDRCPSQQIRNTHTHTDAPLLLLNK